MTFALTPFNVQNAAGTAIPLGSYNDGTNNYPGHVTVDGATGAAVSPATAAGQSATSAAANTTGGASVYYAAALSNTVAAVKASAGNLYSVSFYNPNTTVSFVQLFDVAAGSVTLGTTAPKMVFAVPANGFAEEKFTGEAKIAFLTAVSVAAATAASGSAAPTNGLLTNIVYK